MKVVVCFSGSKTDRVLVQHLKEMGHTVACITLTVEDTLGPRAQTMCREMGVSFDEIGLDGIGEILGLNTDPEGDFLAKGMHYVATALSYGGHIHYAGVAMGYTQDSASRVSQALVAALGSVVALHGMTLITPFLAHTTEEVHRKDQTPPPPPQNVVEGPVATASGPVSVARGPASTVSGPVTRVEAPAAPLMGIRPFIFSAEGVYGYINNRDDFDSVTSQFGSVSGVLEGRMMLPSSGPAPTFTPEGSGATLREWMEETNALDQFVDVTQLTLGGTSHNPGHAGCC